MSKFSDMPAWPHVGAIVWLKIGAVGDVGDREGVRVFPGEVWKVENIRHHAAPQGWTYELSHGSGLVCYIDDTNRVNGEYPWSRGPTTQQEQTS